MSYNILADESFKVYLREACALLPEESQGFVALERPVSKKRLAELGVVRDDFSRVLSIDNWSLRIVLSEALSRGTDGLMYLHTPHGFSPARWVADFCACFCDEIHRIVCTQKKLTAV